jgi:hypothetical protein
MFDPDDREMAELQRLGLVARIAEAKAAEAQGWASAQQTLAHRERAERAQQVRDECLGFFAGRRLATAMVRDEVHQHFQALRASRSATS